MIQGLSQKTLQRLVIASFLLGAAVFFLSWNLAILPVFKKIESLQIQKKESLQKGAVLRDIAVLRKKIDAYEPSFSEKNGLTWLISALDAMAKKSNISFTSIEPLSPQSEGDYQKLQVRLQVIGVYHDLGDFVSQVENSPRFIKILDFQMTNLENVDSADPKLRVSMLLAVFYPAKGAL